MVKLNMMPVVNAMSPFLRGPFYTGPINDIISKSTITHNATQATHLVKYNLSILLTTRNFVKQDRISNGDLFHF